MPQQLAELDTSEIIVPYGGEGAGVPEQKYRDILKLLMAMTDGKAAYCILGIESQMNKHYAMPVRNGIYDFMQLGYQVDETAKSHKRNESAEDYKPDGDEFLSGFWKTDRLIPVITLVVYFSPDKWDAPTSVKQMYAFQDEVLMKYAPDYRINLIAPGQITDEEMDEFHTSLREVMLYIKYSKDRKRLNKLVGEDERFRSVDRQAAEVLNMVTNSDLKYPEGEEAVDVCLAIKEMRMDSEKIGQTTGIIIGGIQAYKSFGKTQEEAAEYIISSYDIDEKKVWEFINKYW